MGEIIKLKRPSAQERHKGKFLCTRGFHRWEIVKERPFDVKSGRLVTHQRCTRCGATRTEAR